MKLVNSIVCGTCGRVDAEYGTWVKVTSTNGIVEAKEFCNLCHSSMRTMVDVAMFADRMSDISIETLIADSVFKVKE